MNKHVRSLHAVAAIIMLFVPAAQAADSTPFCPLDQSRLVIKAADGTLIVADKDGRGLDGIKLSQHDRLIGSPSIAVAPDGVIHVAYGETHRTTGQYGIYHRSSSDGGTTWTEAKNLSEDPPGLVVGRCQVLADASNRVYVIWRVALKEYLGASVDPAGDRTNLWFRELDGGKWTKAKPISELATANNQNDAALSFFTAVDGAGRAQVVWNTQPDKWHPDLKRYGQHSPGVGNGLVFQSTLEGPTASKPREVFLPTIIAPVQKSGPPSCDGLNTLNGYVDAAGNAHFIAAVTRPQDGFAGHPSHFTLIENAKEGQNIDLPNASYHEARDIPTLLVDAKGKRHMIAYYPTGEHPEIRDYLLGSDDEPTVIRAAAGLNGQIDGFQAYQGPGGRMVAIMQMNDTGERFAGDNFVSVSTGEGKWSVPVNVTNNAGRKTFHNTQTSGQSNVGAITSCLPGPGAAAFDRDGHLLLLMVKQEYAIVIATASGVNRAGGDVKIPTLRFLKF